MNHHLIFTRFFLFTLLFSVLFAFPTLPVSAQARLEKPEIIASPTVLEGGLTDPQELESFLDGIIAAQLAAYRIPGATIAVVKDGSLFFAKGYGYANMKEQIPVVADRTLFYPGSVSKLFTWTAVMQLVEQDKLDLDTDINTYLRDFQIPSTYLQPITLVHLMTHSSGFDIQELGTYVKSLEDIAPLDEYIVKHLPARVRAPGEMIAYTNYGTTLAGYIVEQVSGLPYERYIEENIFEPLSMTRSSFRQPLPPELAGDMAIGYAEVDGAFLAQSEWIQPAPVGGLSSTSTDIAKFMIAHLQDGCYGKACILQKVTAQEIHSHHFSSDPRASGWTYGFIEMQLNNQRLIWHGGTTNYFHSTLVLLPEHNVGFFVSFNSPGGLPAWQSLVRVFMDHYYPASHTPLPQLSTGFAQHANRFAGTYLESKCSQLTPEALFSLFFPVTIQATAEGILRIQGYGYGMNSREVSQWLEVEPLVFRSMDGKDTMIFHADAEGRITEMIPRNNPTSVYIKQPWYGSASFQLILLISSILLVVSGILVGPAGFFINRRKPVAKEPSPLLPTLARRLAGFFCILCLFFLVAFFGMMSSPEILYGLPTAMMQIVLIPHMIAALTVGLVIFTGLAWIKGYWGVVGRIHYTLLTISAVAFVWWLDYWHVLGAFWVYR